MNAAIDGSGSFTTLMTGVTPASQISYFTFLAISTTILSRLRLFLETAGGTTSFLHQVSVSANSGVQIANNLWEGSFTPAIPITLPTGYKLKCALSTTATINVFGYGGDY